MEEVGENSRPAEGGRQRPERSSAREPGAGSRSIIALLGQQLRRNVGGLVVPVGLITAALAVLCGTVALLVLEDRVLIIDDQLRPFELSPGLVVLSAVPVVLFLAAHLVMVALAVIMVAGSLLGRPVSAGRALRMVVRRSGALLVLLIMFVLAGAAVLLVLAWVAMIVLTWTAAWPRQAHPTSIAVREAIHTATEASSEWIGLPIAAVAGLVLWRLLLTVPIVILEGARPSRAWARAAEISWHRRGQVFRRLVVTVVLIPVVLASCLTGLVSVLTGIAHAVALVVATLIGVVLTAVVQGTALALVALDQSPPVRPQPGRWPPMVPLDPGAVAARIPADTPAPKPGPLLLALTTLALVAPGLLYGGYVQVNPHGLTALYEQPVVVDDSISEKPVLLDDGTLLVASTRHGDALICSDRRCGDTHELPIIPREWLGQTTTAAPLPDGSWAVAEWVGADENAEDRELKLGRCTAQGCTPPAQAQTIARSANGDIDVKATASGEGILVAASIDTDRDETPDTLQLLRCAGMPCDAPRTLAEVELQAAGSTGIEPIAVATGERGRPVVAYEDRDTGAVTLLSCADTDCHHPVARQPVGPATFADSEEASALRSNALYASGVELVVPPDDRPVLVHREIKTGASRLLRCHTPDCAAVDALVLTEPSRAMEVADLALGHDGLPLVATFDTPRGRAVLIFCNVPDCTQRTTADLGAFSTADRGILDLAVGRDGRPRVVWYWRATATRFRDSPDAQLLTCRAARCAS